MASGLRASDTVTDLFCGAGTFALTLAPQCASVHGFEVQIDRLACWAFSLTSRPVVRLMRCG
jgi:tRNA/tmRNA/rRNA uracil-C5-methylase (TrmA/RlmC/RlmD family)